MTFIYRFILWFAPTLVSWLVAFFTRKLAVVAATIASFILITAAFVVCIKTAILYVLSLAVMPAAFAGAIGMFIPFNFTVVLANIFGAQSCRWAYDKAIEKIALINNAQ